MLNKPKIIALKKFQGLDNTTQIQSSNLAFILVKIKQFYFYKNIKISNGTYIPIYLSQSEFDSIVNSANERFW